MIRLIFSMIAAIVTLSGCVAIPVDGFGMSYQGRRASIQVSGAVQRHTFQQQCFKAVVVNPVHPAYGQQVCAFPGDQNVVFLSRAQPRDLDPNRCPGGYAKGRPGPCGW